MLARWIAIGIALGASTGIACAQGPSPALAWAGYGEASAVRTSTGPSSLDYRVLRAWYTLEHDAIASWMRLADRTAYPMFYGSPLVLWGLAAAEAVEPQVAYRFTAAQVATVGGTFLVKYLVERERPYARHHDIIARRTSDLELVQRPDPRSLPSGHTALAVALATTLALEYPEPYIIVPGILWASSVGLSRVWLGLHYPSDVLLGALLGGGIAWAVHGLGERIVPARLR